MRIGGYSLGMRQRLSVAQALLGDPGVLVFDEPANGLDPEGIRWMRLLMRSLADEGRTVLMSSHLLSEVQQIADKILIMSNGNLVFDGGIEQLADVESPVVAVDSPDRAALSRLLREKGLEFEVLRSGVNVHGTSSAEIGALAAAAGIALSSLQQRGPSLEDVFLDLVSGRRTQQTAALAVRSASATSGTAAPASTPDAVAPPLAPEPPTEAEAEPETETEAVPEPAIEAEAAPEPEPETDAAAETEAAPEPEAEEPASGIASAPAEASAARPEQDVAAVETPAQADAEPDAEDAGDTADERIEVADIDAATPDVADVADDATAADSTDPEPPSVDGDAADDEGADAAPDVITAVPSFDDAPAPGDDAAERIPGEDESTGRDGSEDHGRVEDDDPHPSPWSVGGSFAERLRGTSGDRTDDEPFDVEPVPSHLLETQAMDVLDEAPAGEQSSGHEGEQSSAPDGERPGDGERSGASEAEPEGQEPDGAEPPRS